MNKDAELEKEGGREEASNAVDKSDRAINLPEREAYIVAEIGAGIRGPASVYGEACKSDRGGRCGPQISAQPGNTKHRDDIWGRSCGTKSVRKWAASGGALSAGRRAEFASGQVLTFKPYVWSHDVGRLGEKEPHSVTPETLTEKSRCVQSRGPMWPGVRHVCLVAAGTLGALQSVGGASDAR